MPDHNFQHHLQTSSTTYIQIADRHQRLPVWTIIHQTAVENILLFYTYDGILRANKKSTHTNTKATPPAIIHVG